MSNPNSPAWKRLALCIVIAGAFALLLLASFAATPALALQAVLSQTSVADFNPGIFFHSGPTASTQNGGDGDGEVRLLNVGINASTWNPGGTANTSGLPTNGLWAHAAAQRAGKIYVSGGNDGSGPRAGVYYSTIQPNHNLSNWTTAPALPETRFRHAMTALGSYLYVIAGIGGSPAAVKPTVYKAQIAGDGSLGSWSATTPLPVDLVNDQGLYDLRALSLGGRIYVLGGYNYAGYSKDSIYIGTADNSGNLTWTQSGVNLPLPLASHAATTSSGRIYVAGGLNNQANTSDYSPDVYYTTPQANGTPSGWTKGTYPIGAGNITFAAAVAFADQLYIVGGSSNSGGSPRNVVTSDLLDTDGAIMNVWTDSPVLSANRINTDAVMSNDGWIYVIEGGTGSDGLTPLPTVDYGPTAAALGTQHYAPSGSYSSPSLDLLAPDDMQKLMVYANLPTGTGMTVQWRASDDPTFQGVNWSDPTTLSASPLTVTLTGTHNRYFQYKVGLTSDVNGTVSPVLNRVDLYYTKPDPPTPTPTETNTATATSQATNTPTQTQTPGKSFTPSRTPTKTLTPTNTKVPSRTPTSTKTKAPGTVTKTRTPTKTLTPTKTPAATKLEDVDYRLQYDQWRGLSSTSAYGGTFRFSDHAGHTATFNFSGGSISWYTRKSSDGGMAQVVIDGKDKGTFDLYSSSVSWKVVKIFSKLGSGSHRIVIKVLGTSNPSSSGTVVVVDGFKTGTKVTQDSSYAIQWNNWRGVSSTSASGGSYRQNNNGDTTFTFNFSGTFVNWTTMKCPACGQAHVWIGTDDKGIVDLYSTKTVWKFVEGFSGLAPGPHTLTIEILGTKDAASSGTRVVIDAISGTPN